MAVICPTVTAKDPHTYRTQLERVALFSDRIHLDLADGKFATKSIEINKIWLPDKKTVSDIHIMYENPADYLDKLISLSPNLVIVHAEADGNFPEIARRLHEANIKAGVALLAETEPDVIVPSIEHIDHVLVFSGHLGHFGGVADLTLLGKVDKLRKLKKDLEIGWDGGINDKNARELIAGGVDVLNVGGYIQRSENPDKAYAKLNLLV